MSGYHIKIWSITEGQLLNEINIKPEESGLILINCFLIRNNQNIFIRYDNIIEIWKIEELTRLKKVKHSFDSSTSFNCFDVDSNGTRYLAIAEKDEIAGLDEIIEIRDTESGDCITRLAGRNGLIAAAKFSPDDQKVLSASGDNVLKLWDIESGDCLMQFVGHEDSVFNIAFSNDGNYIASSCHDNVLKLWDANSGECLLTRRNYSGLISKIEIEQESQYLRMTTRDGTETIWDTDKNLSIFSSDISKKEILRNRFLIYSPNGKLMFQRPFALITKEIQVLDTQTGECLFSIIEGRKDESFHLATFSPDSSLIGTVSMPSREVKIWDANNGQIMIGLQGHENYLADKIAFNPNGSIIVTSGWTAPLKVWDLKNGQCMWSLKSNSESNNITSLSISPDGRYLVIGRYDGLIEILSLVKGDLIQSLSGHNSSIHGIVFLPDNSRKFATYSSDRTVKIWDMTIGNFIRSFTSVPGLHIQGCDFRKFDKSSELSDKQIKILKQYGGIFNDEDYLKWQETMIQISNQFSKRHKEKA